MLKYYKEYIGQYEFADILQTVSLILFVIFFVMLVWYVYSKPNSYYKKVSELPLEEDSDTKTQNNS